MTCTRSYTQSEVPMMAAVKLAMVMREEEEYEEEVEDGAKGDEEEALEE